MITFYSFIYNEEVFLPYMIDTYKRNFPNCDIVIFDNQSTDNSKQIALNKGCKVIDFDTNNEIDDDKIKVLKNTCWKNDKNNWVGLIDCDEIIQMTENDLIKEQNLGTTIIKPQAYTMINMYDNYDFDNITYGFRDYMYDKTYIFNKQFINEINFNHGAHNSSPIGLVKYNSNIYKLFHYKYLNVDYHILRNKYTFNRLSVLNKKNGWGVQWHRTDEQIKQDFENMRKTAIKVL